MVFSRAVRRARGHPFFSLATVTVVVPTRSFARSFSFSLPSTPIELSQTRSGPHGDRLSSVTTVLIISPVSSQQAGTSTYRWSNLQQHIAVQLNFIPSSVTEFSRQPAQPAGSLPVSWPSQKALHALPTLFLTRHSNFMHHKTHVHKVFPQNTFIVHPTLRQLSDI